MVTIPDLSQSAIAESLKDSLRYIEDERVRERDYLMDWYEGINIESYVNMTTLVLRHSGKRHYLIQI